MKRIFCLALAMTALSASAETFGVVLYDGVVIVAGAEKRCAPTVVYDEPVVYNAPVNYEGTVIYNGPVVYNTGYGSDYSASGYPGSSYGYYNTGCDSPTVIYTGRSRYSYDCSPNVIYFGRGQACREGYSFRARR